jgi:multimeric flavodoxin WrbA
MHGEAAMKAIILSSSPRRDGNSAQLAAAVGQGITEAGHEAEVVFASDVLRAFLGDCRTCRRADGECAIEDGFRTIFLEKFLPADGFVAATPVYWYGMSAQLKTFFDRMFCYVAASHPGSAGVVAGMKGKRIGLAISSEETFPTVAAAIVHQLQEYSRYTHSEFIGAVHGIGNARGDVRKDPRDPLTEARRFGQSFFSAHATDYKIDTVRSGRVWG